MQKVNKKPNRNDACDCGSGKKYKNCCLTKDLEATSTVNNRVRWVAESMANAIQAHQTGQLGEAQSIYQQVLENDPQHAEALHYLGVIAYQLKDYTTAEPLMLKAIDIDPSIAAYHCNYGMLLNDTGRYRAAEERHRRALALKPDYIEAHLNLGVSLFKLRLFEEAGSCFRATIQLTPTSAKAFDNLGTVFREQFDYASAIQHYQHALKLEPSYVLSYANLAATYIELKNFPVASSYCLQALEQDKNCADAYMYLGMIRQEEHDFGGAESFYLHAIALAPDNYNARWNLGLVQLAAGKIEQGWHGYEARWQKSSNPIPQQKFPYRWWQGESLPDKTILVWGEQGLGDEIMFASMYADLIDCFAHCIVVCNAKLVPLFRQSFPQAEIISQDDRIALGELGNRVDVQSAAGSLGRWLRPSVNSFPNRLQYLTANSQRVAYWRDRLAALGPGLKVGISWRTSNLAGNRVLYCTELDQWGPILAVPGVHFVKLQYDECNQELARSRELSGVPIHAFDEVDLFNDLAEAAALTKALDLVISAPTSAFIQAAALGVPSWPMISGFFWQTFGTGEIAWYKTATLFQKDWSNNWEPMIQEIAIKLGQRVAASKGTTLLNDQMT